MKKGQKGFSLLEVACILMLMGLVGLAAVPTISNVKRQEVSQFVTELGTDFLQIYQSINTNDEEQCTLQLTSGSSGKYIGYTLNDSKGLFLQKERSGASSFDVKVYKDAEHTPTALWSDSASTYYFTKQGILDTVPTPGATGEQVITFEIASENVSQIWYIVFYLETGHYEISSVDI